MDPVRSSRRRREKATEVTVAGFSGSARSSKKPTVTAPGSRGSSRRPKKTSVLLDPSNPLPTEETTFPAPRSSRSLRSRRKKAATFTAPGSSGSSRGLKTASLLFDPFNPLKTAPNLKECEFYYHRIHVGRGAVLMNPDSLKPLPFVYRGGDPRRFLGNEGPQAFAVIHKDSILVAFNHSIPVRRRPDLDLNIVGRCTFAFISGTNRRRCRIKMEQLKKECMELGDFGANVRTAIYLMIKKLSRSHLVGLVAGWDEITGSGGVFLVDGTGGVIKKDALPIGHGFMSLYPYLEMEHLSTKEASDLALRTICEFACNAFYSGKLASVIRVGHEGVVYCEVNTRVKHFAIANKLCVILTRTKGDPMAYGYLPSDCYSDTESDDSGFVGEAE